MNSVASSTVGLVGVGHMGSRMGQRIVQAGEELVGYDSDPQRVAASEFLAAESLAELVRDCDVILLSLPDSNAVETVVYGDNGFLAGGRRGQIVVDLSTSSPDSTQRIQEKLYTRGIEFLDAGISGGAKAAEAGSLTLMVGGSTSALEQVRPILGHFSSNIFHMGASGNGHVAKLLNNFLNGVSLAATSEVMVAARKSGLDPRQLLEVLNNSSGVNFATLNRFPHIVEGDYLEGGLTGRLMAKDIKLYLDYVGRVGVPTFSGPACLATFEVANSLGYEQKISNRVVDAIGDMAGGVRLYEDTTSKEEQG